MSYVDDKNELTSPSSYVTIKLNYHPGELRRRNLTTILGLRRGNLTTIPRSNVEVI
jgi:hypothetical protein